MKEEGNAVVFSNPPWTELEIMLLSGNKCHLVRKKMKVKIELWDGLCRSCINCVSLLVVCLFTRVRPGRSLQRKFWCS